MALPDIGENCSNHEWELIDTRVKILGVGNNYDIAQIAKTFWCQRCEETTIKTKLVRMNKSMSESVDSPGSPSRFDT